MLNFKIIKIIILLLIISGCSKLGVDLDPPEIEGYYPGHNQYNVPNNAHVWIQFNEQMDIESVQNAFNIESEGDHNGTFGWENNTKIYYFFEKAMGTGKKYSITLSKHAKDRTGNSLTKDLLFTFYVNHEDATKPVITQTVPANMSEGVNKDTDIYITFSKPMDENSVRDNFSISPSANGAFNWNTDCTIMHYQVLNDLEASTRYEVTLGKDTKDKDGYQLGTDYKFNFLTGDTYSLPEILGVYSYGGASTNYWINYQDNIDKNVQIAIHFNKSMSHSDTESAFSLSPSVNGYYTWITTVGETMIFHPTEYFQSETIYNLNISSTAKDLDNHQLEQEYELHFTINGSNSLNLKITNVSDNQGNSLSFDTVDNVQLNGTETNTFTVNFNLTSPNMLDISSFQGHVSISRISGWGDTTKLGVIEDYNYNFDYTKAYIKIGSISSNNYYKLTFDGTESGIKDINGNYMQDDLEIMFLTE